jgi:hypothetical protein
MKNYVWSRARALVKAGNENQWELGHELEKVRKKLLPQGTFEKGCKSELGMSPHAARCMIRVSQAHTRSEVAQFGWSKLHYLYMARQRPGALGKRFWEAILANVSTSRLRAMLRADLDSRPLRVRIGRPRNAPTFAVMFDRAMEMSSTEQDRLWKAIKRARELGVNLPATQAALRKAA